MYAVNLPYPSSLRILRASSRERDDLLGNRLESFRARGIRVLYDDLPEDPTWTYTCASIEDRARAVTEALLAEEPGIIMFARGGYGASDLLPYIPWSSLANRPPKLLVGFSDVSALHAALYAKLGWEGLHAPMPATNLWPDDDAQAQDTSLLWRLLAAYEQGAPMSSKLAVTSLRCASGSDRGQAPLSGRLFGGCMTVLTNLIGTPYFPRSLSGHILFVEDTGEHPAKLMRALNQWLQSGALEGARALVIGYLRDLGEKIPDCAPFVYERMATVTRMPVYTTPLIGHTAPNMPLLVGGYGTLSQGVLEWSDRRVTPLAST